MPPGEQSKPPIRRILILRSSALGDVIHVLPSLEALRSLYPDAEISWLTEPLGANLLGDHPQIDHLYVQRRQEWKRRMRNPLRWPGVFRDVGSLAWKLRRQRFDLVLDFQCNLRSALTLLLVGGRTRLGFHRDNAREFAGRWLTNQRIGRLPTRLNKVEKNLALIRALGFEGPCPKGQLPLDEAHLSWAREYLRGLPGSGPAVIIHPAVSRFGRIKQWPVGHFRRFIDLLTEQFDARVAITWGPGEEPLATSIDRPRVLEEAIGLRQMAALIQVADLAVAADTGTVPLAAVVGTPSIGLYGPKDAVVYRAYPPNGIAIASPAPCSPCRLRRCEHRICMTLITPETVLDAARAVLSAPAAGPQDASGTPQECGV